MKPRPTAIWDAHATAAGLPFTALAQDAGLDMAAARYAVAGLLA